jgi:hypothetical protein
MVTSGVRNARAYPMRDYSNCCATGIRTLRRAVRAVTRAPLMGESSTSRTTTMVDPGERIPTPTRTTPRGAAAFHWFGSFLLKSADGRQQGGRRRQAPLHLRREARSRGSRGSSPAGPYPVAPGAQPRNHNPREFVGEMIPVEANHESGAKLLLRRDARAGGNEVRCAISTSRWPTSCRTRTSAPLSAAS